MVEPGTSNSVTRVRFPPPASVLSDVRIAQHLYDAIQEYGGFDRPDWLG
jgi:hypothetical protein